MLFLYVSFYAKDPKRGPTKLLNVLKGLSHGILKITVKLKET